MRADFAERGASGRMVKRPELEACLAYLREDDTLVINRLSPAVP